MKVGIFHWSFDELGGGEVLSSYLAKALDTSVFSIIKDPEKNKLGFIDVSPKLPLITRYIRKIRSLDYLCWSNVDINDFGDFDVVITSGLTARAIITPDSVPHIHYNHSPARWLYDLWHYRRKSKGWLKQNFILPLAGDFFRMYDQSVDNRVDYYFSNSEITQRRLWKYLKRESIILYPPVETKKYKNSESEDYYLFIGRLWEEKRPEVAIAACLQLNKKLVIIGDENKKLIHKYKDNSLIDFRGNVTEQEKIDLLSSCKCVLYPAKAEDYGIVPFESFASGKPVICSNDGFPPLVVGQNNGIVSDGSISGIKKAIQEIEVLNYDPDKLRKFASKYDFSIFKKKLMYYMNIFQEDFEQRKEFVKSVKSTTPP